MGMVLTFIEKLEGIVANWIDNEKMSFHELAKRVEIPIPHVLDYITLGLSKNLEVHDMISRREVDLALSSLRQKMRLEIEAQERRHQERRDRAQKAYESTMEKVRQKQAEKSIYNAYRTLSYFAGTHEGLLTKDVLITISNDCLRLGLKGGANRQELATWLQKGVRLCLASENPDSVEDAKDFLDTYADAFVCERGQQTTFVEALRVMVDKILSPQNADLGAYGNTPYTDDFILSTEAANLLPESTT